jgi:hypothetical protein
MTSAPEFLSPRLDKPHPEKWRIQQANPTLNEVSADWSKGLISTSYNNTNTSKALQKFAMIKARYGIDGDEYFDKSVIGDLENSRSLKIADQIATLYLMSEKGNDNAEIPTLSGNSIAEHIAKQEFREIVYANSSLLFTKEHKKFMRRIKELETEETVKKLQGINKEIKKYIKRFQLANTQECNWLEGMTIGEYNRVRIARLIEARSKSAPKKSETKKLKEAFGQRPDLIEGMNPFYDLVVSKPDRTLGHSGRMGRSKKSEQIGRNLTRPHNYYGDNQRRVFTRYASGRGAVVLLDLSGSMSLSTEQVDQMIEASHGSTIIGYSMGEQSEPNCWVIAHNNTRMRGIPRVRGGNGVDVPAMLYADTYRTTRQPLIWVSDGHATGIDDNMNEAVLEATAKTVQALGIHQVEDVEEAIELMAKMQRGQNPKPKMCSMLWRYA